jgi:hypothetical protein
MFSYLSLTVSIIIAQSFVCPFCYELQFKFLIQFIDFSHLSGVNKLQSSWHLFCSLYFWYLVSLLVSQFSTLFYSVVFMLAVYIHWQTISCFCIMSTQHRPAKNHRISPGNDGQGRTIRFRSKTNPPNCTISKQATEAYLVLSPFVHSIIHSN